MVASVAVVMSEGWTVVTVGSGVTVVSATSLSVVVMSGAWEVIAAAVVVSAVVVSSSRG